MVLEKILESPLDCKESQPIHSEGYYPWDFFGRNDAKAEPPVLWPPHAKKLTHLKRLWCWEGLGAGREGDDRGWDGWMASPNLWTWVWVNSRSLWWTGRPGVLQFMGSQSQTPLSDWTELRGVKQSDVVSRSAQIFIYSVNIYLLVSDLIHLFLGNYQCYDPITTFLIILVLFSVSRAFPSLVFFLEKFLCICCKAGLVMLNSFNFCLSGKLLISPSNLKDSLSG